MNGDTTAQPEQRQFSTNEIAAFTKIYRESVGWSQETLAEISGLTTRTIQRVENAEPSSIDTRRALARAFKLEDIDVFNKIHSFKTKEQVEKEAADFKKENLVLDTSTAKSGKELADLAESITMYSFQQSDEITQEAGEIGANLFDYIKDYGDADELYSFAQKISVHLELSNYISSLTQAGYSICYAVRKTKIVGKNWRDKSPWPVTLGYFFLAPIGCEPKQIAVPIEINVSF